MNTVHPNIQIQLSQTWIGNVSMDEIYGQGRELSPRI